MLELFFVVLSFVVGRSIGIEQYKNNRNKNNLNELEFKILDAENRAESWKRRYNNLLGSIKSKEESNE